MPFQPWQGDSPQPRVGAWVRGSCRAGVEHPGSRHSAPPHPLQVPEIIKHVYHHMPSATDAMAQETIRKVLHVLAQTYTDEVVLTLFEMDEQSQRWVGSPGRQTSPRLCRSAYS